MESIIPLGVIAANAIISFIGFSRHDIFNRLMLHILPIRRNGEIYRLFTSGFLHVDFFHLLVNMFVLYSFSEVLLLSFGVATFFAVYLGSLLLGNVLSIMIRKNEMDYRAVGASGAVSGIVFASIITYPDQTLLILPIPIPIPSWLFGIMYISYSLYGMRNRFDNVGHEAHLGGALSGIVIASMLHPILFMENPLFVGILFVAAMSIFLLAVFQPSMLGLQSRNNDYLE